MDLMNGTTIQNGTLGSSWVEHVLVPCCFLGICFILGVPGNALVIWTIIFHIKQKSFTVLLIFNLATADFMLLITLPIWIHALADNWVYGLSFCKFLTYVIYFSMYASVFFITLMSIERLMAVLFPFGTQKWMRKKVLYTLVSVIWFSSALCSVPILVIRTTVEKSGRVQCSEREYFSRQQQIAILLLETIFGFAVPFMILLACYATVMFKIKHMTFTTRKKPEKLIAGIVIAFFICWFPYHVFNLLMVVSVALKSSGHGSTEHLDKIIKAGENIPGALAFFSSCVNPILYAFAAQSVRKGFQLSSFARLFRQISPSEDEKPTKESWSLEEKISKNISI
ncbi:C3a anaphylatoxin chemotactic receptor-like [Protopterus annectens]|uniref:C3a anaphylatoxin chemotactic receptor-like n=1 Tax=Protopterus annectens TaxID=7888 RepID=UPI001CF9C614|nr:C3a anaphylatoxin chemotactic receptor-like [Protopterus annectens]